MKVVKVLMVCIFMVMPLAVKVLQSEGQIPEKSVTEKSTKPVRSPGKNELIPEIKDTKLTSDSLSTESGKS